MVDGKDTPKHIKSTKILLGIFVLFASLVGLTMTRCASIGDPPSEMPHSTQLLNTAAPMSTSTPTPSPPPIRPSTQDAPAGLVAYLDLKRQAWLMNSNGSDPRQLNLCTGEVRDLVWSPGGRGLGYICKVDNADEGQAGIYTLSTGDRHPIGPAVWALSRLSWSPDGCHLVLDGGTSIVRELEIINVTSGQVIVEIEAIAYAWSPEGDALLFGQRRPLEEPLPVEPLDSVSLAVLPLNRREPTILLEGSSEMMYIPKAWLPDNRLLYERLEWDDENQRARHSLWTLTYRTGSVGVPQPAASVPVVHDREAILLRLPDEFQNANTGGFSWSLEGYWMAFHTGAWPDTTVYVVDWREEGSPRKLARGSSPAWQPVSAPVRCTLP